MSTTQYPSGGPQALDEARAEIRRGLMFGFGAYFLWGFGALYFKMLEHVPPAEVVAHRSIWAVPLVWALLMVMGRTGDILRALRSPKVVATLCVTASLIAINWGLFLYAIASEQTLEASLAYYINPLLNVVVGFALLGERFTRTQTLAVAIAAAAVAIETAVLGQFPWLALCMASSFCVYAYLRKTMPVGPAQGFFVETLLLFPLALVYVGYLFTAGTGHFLGSAEDTALLMVAALVTALPLILFAAGARRLKLATIGLMQYIAPSMMFLTAVFIFHEPLELVKLFTFIAIWVALAAFTVSALNEDRKARTLVAQGG